MKQENQFKDHFDQDIQKKEIGESDSSSDIDSAFREEDMAVDDAENEDSYFDDGMILDVRPLKEI